MEFNTQELCAIEVTSGKPVDTADIEQLSSFQLMLVGGGCGEVIIG